VDDAERGGKVQKAKDAECGGGYRKLRYLIGTWETVESVEC